MRRVLTRIHTAPGRPRLVAGAQAGWWRVLPVALLGCLIAAGIVADRVGLPDELDPIAPFVVGHHTGIDQALMAHGVPVGTPLSQYGYDGQWFLGQANDPLLRGDMPLLFDVPQYRSLRMLYPTAGWLLAGGQPGATPYALLVLAILGVGLGCAAVARIVSGYGRSVWWGLVFAAVPGVVVGVAYGTAEPLGLALAAVGVTLTLDRRYGWAGLAFAGSALTKESYLAFAAVTAVYLMVDARVHRTPWLRRAAAVALPGAAILLLWWVYVTATLPPDDNPYSSLGRFAVPFLGWLEAFGAIARGEYPATLAGQVVLVASFAALVAAVVLGLRLRQSLPAYLGVAWGLFGLIIAGFLLERFLSANRALAPAVLAALVFLLTVRRPAKPPG